ncbi:MAG: hypothetical protein WD176_10625 [Pirellulales bacterium]
MTDFPSPRIEPARRDDFLDIAALDRQFGFEVRERVEGYYRPHEHRYVMAYSPVEKTADEEF